MAVADAQCFQFLGYPVGFHVTRQGASLHLEKDTCIGGGLHDPDSTDILRQQVSLHPLGIVATRKGPDL